MKLLHTQENTFSLSNIQNLIEAEGISTLIKNQHLGAGSGEMPHFETWPELWVHNDADYPRAKVILDKILEQQSAPAEAWNCGACGEENDASFEICWQCGSDS
ncbi:DUF2007 domain-containing protein [Pseudoteredinibacter isoporae]|uniref:RanBP2-type domain-containing protein n=1 Tax=Pseudoteredinibacter isoporae TaxID=570281 RepID=A0A7X0JQS1_9GAMM|nr:DUF2007 domain-containing protein [Pseudoteredinibacter isoporae]MBB6520569.1 hypothetical protein [Pseudoteredinibacter isoporae]NHO86136.1 DUF2007 domain-containing protein [Pseudoteredinibacter isoporae]NIB25413.1 DUF2007 domain-containing protein [Pseudoteredinibacter isoporae]